MTIMDSFNSCLPIQQSEPKRSSTEKRAGSFSCNPTRDSWVLINTLQYVDFWAQQSAIQHRRNDSIETHSDHSYFIHLNQYVRVLFTPVIDTQGDTVDQQ